MGKSDRGPFHPLAHSVSRDLNTCLIVSQLANFSVTEATRVRIGQRLGSMRQQLLRRHPLGPEPVAAAALAALLAAVEMMAEHAC